MTTLSDEDVVRRVREGDTALFEVLMRRYNQRIYRVVRAIVKDPSEAEDVMQQAYLNAYRHLDQYAGRASVPTWLTKIAVYEALGRMRRQRPMTSLDEPVTEGTTLMDSMTSPALNPEQSLLAQESAGLLEAAVTALPDTYRTVFMLREVEGLSTEETADVLGLNQDTVKTRLHRARLDLRQRLSDQVTAAAPKAFELHARRCDRVVANVLAAIGASHGEGPG